MSPGFLSHAMTLVAGLVFFTIRWWNPETFAAMHPVGTARRVSWPYVDDKPYLFTWLFLIPLVVYTLWQVLYFLIVNVLRRQRLLRDPEVMTSYRYPSSVIIPCLLTVDSTRPLVSAESCRRKLKRRTISCGS